MEREGVACTIYDTLMYAMDDVAEQLKLPAIILQTCSFAAMAAFAEMPCLKKEGYIPFEDSKLQELVPGLDTLRRKDLPLSNFTDIESKLKIIAIYGNIKRVSSVISNSVDCLEYLPLAEFQKKHKIPFFSVGPLFKIASTSSTSLINTDENCIK